MNYAAPKVFVIGLDCAEPDLVFNRWRERLPNLSRLAAAGVSGTLESTIPPITVPAWTSMMTGNDPGQLGLYGFRNRKDYSYDALYFADARYVCEPTVWDFLSRARRRSILIGIPQTYPARPLNGIMVTSFLAPDKGDGFTYPPEMAAEVDRLAGGDYIVDIKDFRTEDKPWLLEFIYTMTRRRFRVIRELLVKEPWDMFMFVEMGVDRIHHGFWRYHDPAHRLYQPGNPYENVIRDYYTYLDGEIGSLLDSLPNGTVVLVVSDHGAKTMVGGIAINEWLMRNGYLELKEPPGEQAPLKYQMIRWEKTRAWGEGGYYSRIFMNVQGREPTGVVSPKEYECLRDELTELLEAMTDEHGQLLGTRVFKPQAIYRECRNIPPDLIVYFGDLDWRSVGSIGSGTIYHYENDTGPDDANHAQQGLYILARTSDLGQAPHFGGKRMHRTILDVTPTLLELFGLEVPRDFSGRSFANDICA